MLSIYFVLIYYFKIYDNTFTRKDCYETFSSYKEYFELFHYFPTGPPYIFIKVNLKFYSYIYGFLKTEIWVQYHLKRINVSCSSSFIFSTIGKDFRKMHFSIEIYLYYNSNKIADIQYIFFKGYYPGYYTFANDYQNFGMSVHVYDVIHELFNAKNSSWLDAKFYLEGLYIKNGEICVVTENNNAVVLKPDNDSIKIRGVITSIEVRFVYVKWIMLKKQFPAFSCNKNNLYPNETVVFIFDKYEYDLSFKALYWQINGKYVNEHSIIFKISNEKFLDVHLMNLLPQKYQKVFLIYEQIYQSYYPNGTDIIIYKSRNGTIYLYKEFKAVEVSRGVIQNLWVYKFPL